MEGGKYYWILPYAKKLGTFFASDIHEALKKDDFYFHIAAIVVAIEYWIAAGRITILPHNYTSSGHQIKKYGYVDQKEDE